MGVCQTYMKWCLDVSCHMLLLAHGDSSTQSRRLNTRAATHVETRLTFPSKTTPNSILLFTSPLAHTQATDPVLVRALRAYVSFSAPTDKARSRRRQPAPNTTDPTATAHSTSAAPADPTGAAAVEEEKEEWEEWEDEEARACRCASLSLIKEHTLFSFHLLIQTPNQP